MDEMTYKEMEELDSVENLLKELAEWRKLGPLGAVQELVRAEAEGRIVVLPEKS